jgi:hypothetical protein
MKMSQTKIVEKIKTHILRLIFFFENRAVWDNVENYDMAGQATDSNIIWRLQIAWCVAKATDTQSEYVMLIAFPQQHWFKRVSKLRYTYIACPVFGTPSCLCIYTGL